MRWTDEKLASNKYKYLGQTTVHDSNMKIDQDSIESPLSKRYANPGDMSYETRQIKT